jgi:hypothetical protein
MASGDQDSPVTLTGHSVTLNCELEAFTKLDPPADADLRTITAQAIPPERQIWYGIKPAETGRYIGKIVIVDLKTADHKTWVYRKKGHTFHFHYQLNGSKGSIIISDYDAVISIAFDSKILAPLGGLKVYQCDKAKLEPDIDVTSKSGRTGQIEIRNPKYCQIQLFMMPGP